MAEQKENFFTPAVSFWCIFIGVVFIILNITIEPVRNFFFVSMFGNYFNAAPSFFTILITVGTLVGLGVAAYFYRGLAKAANQQNIIQVKRAEQDAFDKAVSQLDVKNPTMAWHAGLRSLIFIACQNPCDFGESAITILIKTGQYFTRSYINKSLSRKRELDYFNFQLIAGIGDISIVIKGDANAILEQEIFIERINVIKEEGVDCFQIANSFFDDMVFQKCNFGGIEFYKTSFKNTIFNKNENFRFVGCNLTPVVKQRTREHINEFHLQEYDLKSGEIKNIMRNDKLGTKENYYNKICEIIDT